MKRKLNILLAVLVLAGLTATAQIQRGSKKETPPKTEQTQKKQTLPKTNQGQAKKQGTNQQAKGNSSSKKGNTSSTPKVERFTANGVTFEMVYVEGGTFTMGATKEQSQDAYDYETPAHQVTLSDYYIGKYEVTQQLWQAVMGTNPSCFDGNSRRPVDNVSWKDCQEFIGKLNQLTDRIPTEAEWEYAARGGNQSCHYKYSGGNRSSNVAWIEDNSGRTTHPVGQKSPNELGLYDMSGNVYEWCQDWWGDYSSESQTNPTGPESGSLRVLRGGCWYDTAWNCRVSYRGPEHEWEGNYSRGLRLAL